MTYQHKIARPVMAEPARPAVITIDGGDYVPQGGGAFSSRRRMAIILAVSAVLWLGIVLLMFAAIG